MQATAYLGLLAIGVLATAILVILVPVYVCFRRDIHAAKKRVGSGGSQVIETASGPVEYATYGEGHPVLVVHGIFGGFDQGLMWARGNLAAAEFQAIVPSRYGYLRTPLPEDASPAGQADAYACVLDALGIDEIAIIGISAGGTSAMQFALRHPDRCSALVLVASNAPGEAEAALLPESLANVMFRSDVLFWLLTTYFSSSMNSIMGVPEGFELTPELEADVANVMRTLLPVNPRADGAIFDMFTSNPDINTGYPLGEIIVPVLVINAVDDPLSLYVNAQSMAEMIPEARLVTIESGGHMMLGHEERIRSEIVKFLEMYVPP